MIPYGEHEITHGASPLSCAAALANLEVASDPEVLSTVADRGTAFRARLRERLDCLGVEHEVRGVGYVSGIAFPDPSTATGVYEKCLADGLVLRRSKVGERASVLQIKPPIITSEASMDSALDILVRATEVVAAEVGVQR